MVLTVGFIDGFDHYPDSYNANPLGFTSTWIPAGISVSGFTATFVTGFRGRGKAAQINNNAFSTRFQRAVPSATQISNHIAVNFYNMDGSNTKPFLSWRNSSAASIFRLQMRPTGRLGLYDGAALVSESSFALLQDVVYRLNMAFDFSTPAASSMKLWINGDLAKGFDLSGVDLSGVSGPVVMVGLDQAGYGSDADEGYDYRVDDYVHCYGAAQNIGELEVLTDGPTSDVQQEWTPSSGTDNYAMVDELPPDADTSYNSSTVVGNIDLQGFPVLPTAPDSIFCVSQILGARKEEAGTRSIAAVVGQTGNTIGPDQTLTTDYDWYYQHYLENPETVAAWLQSEREAASFGYEDAA